MICAVVLANVGARSWPDQLLLKRRLVKKSTKRTSPPDLEIPQKPGIPTFQQLRRLRRVESLTQNTKPAIFNCSQQIVEQKPPTPPRSGDKLLAPNNVLGIGEFLFSTCLLLSGDLHKHESVARCACAPSQLSTRRSSPICRRLCSNDDGGFFRIMLVEDLLHRGRQGKLRFSAAQDCHLLRQQEQLRFAGRRRISREGEAYIVSSGYLALRQVS